MDGFRKSIKNTEVEDRIGQMIFSKMLPFLTYPQAHLLIYDIQTQKTTDMGQVQNWDAISRTLAVDDLGRIYGCWGQGKIWSYDPEINVVENLHIQLPQRKVGIPTHRAYWETEQTFTAVAHSSNHKLIYFLETGSSYLVVYDPYKGPEGEMRLLDQICADRYRDKRDVPYAMISFCLTNGFQCFMAIHFGHQYVKAYQIVTLT